MIMGELGSQLYDEEPVAVKKTFEIHRGDGGVRRCHQLALRGCGRAVVHSSVRGRVAGLVARADFGLPTYDTCLPDLRWLFYFFRIHVSAHRDERRLSALWL